VDGGARMSGAEIGMAGRVWGEALRAGPARPGQALQKSSGVANQISESFLADVVLLPHFQGFLCQIIEGLLFCESPWPSCIETGASPRL